MCDVMLNCPSALETLFTGQGTSSDLFVLFLFYFFQMKRNNMFKMCGVYFIPGCYIPLVEPCVVATQHPDDHDRLPQVYRDTQVR